MEKKRVDVKETRNLAKNKGREKKDGRKTAPEPSSTGTEVSVQTAISDVLHLLDYILIAAGEDEAGEAEGVETEDDGSRSGGY